MKDVGKIILFMFIILQTSIGLAQSSFQIGKYDKDDETKSSFTIDMNTLKEMIFSGKSYDELSIEKASIYYCKVKNYGRININYFLMVEFALDDIEGTQFFTRKLKSKSGKLLLIENPDGGSFAKNPCCSKADETNFVCKTEGKMKGFASDSELSVCDCEIRNFKDKKGKYDAGEIYKHFKKLKSTK